MCGIICEVSYCIGGTLLIKDDYKLLKRIERRGPDANNFKQVNVTGSLVISFYGAVMWMQGKRVNYQPMEDEFGVLLFNGDIYDETWDAEVGDTQLIFDQLSSTKGDDIAITTVIRQLKGPFSIIYYCKLTQMLYFSRDRIGRNSLLFYYNENKILISSVLSKNYKCVEISAKSIYKLNTMSKKTYQYHWNKIEIDTIKLDLHHWDNNRKYERCNDHLKDKEVVSDQDNEIMNYIKKTSNINIKELLMEKLLENIIIKQILNRVLELLQKSVKIRIQRQPNKCKLCLLNSQQCDHSAIGILFSGGLDCTILAFLADQYVPINQSIDLMNVAFQKDNNTDYEVPDRITGRKSLGELQKLCPNRQWVFREINVSKEELMSLRQDDVANLLYPQQTVLDENLGSALWFAARGQDETGTSPCRIVFLGSGADELFGGYTRHRNMFRRSGWTGLKHELDYDWGRISYRNLARDNRIICDHGRQPRMPYLDDEFSDYVANLKPWFRCYPTETMEAGVGDKLMLRLVAFHLGLKQVATFPKRALQFGSRIANKKDKGDDISEVFK